MKKLLTLLLATILILGTAVGDLACNTTENGAISAEAKSLMGKIPNGISSFLFIDVEALRGDDDLEDSYEKIEHYIDIWWVGVDIDIDDVDCFAVYGWETILLHGNFDLDDIREELEAQAFNDADEYNSVEIWERYGDAWVAIMSSLIIMGTEDGVKECIDVIEEGEDSILDDNDCKSTMDRLPGGILLQFGTADWTVEWAGLEAGGMSIQKKDDDTLKTTLVFKFDDADNAEEAIDDIEGAAKDEDYDKVNVDQDGEFAILTAEIDIEDLPGPW